MKLNPGERSEIASLNACQMAAEAGRRAYQEGARSSIQEAMAHAKVDERRDPWPLVGFFQEGWDSESLGVPVWFPSEG